MRLAILLTCLAAALIVACTVDITFEIPTPDLPEIKLPTLPDLYPSFDLGVGRD